MLTLRPPTPDRLAAMVERSRSLPATATPGLLDRDERWWFVDRHREVVGHGRDDFDAACDAIADWAKFRQPWTMPALPLAPIEAGAIAGYSARVHGVWWSYTCRITAVIDERDAPSPRFGFDYVTLRGHAERGEERFSVDMADDGTVAFELFAMSRPGRWFTWVGLPLARRAQARFRPGAAAAVRAHVGRSRANVAH